MFIFAERWKRKNNFCCWFMFSWKVWFLFPWGLNVDFSVGGNPAFTRKESGINYEFCVKYWGIFHHNVELKQLNNSTSPSAWAAYFFFPKRFHFSSLCEGISNVFILLSSPSPCHNGTFSQKRQWLKRFLWKLSQKLCWEMFH